MDAQLTRFGAYLFYNLGYNALVIYILLYRVVATRFGTVSPYRESWNLCATFPCSPDLEHFYYEPGVLIHISPSTWGSST